MKVALISDIHGNSVALDTVLEGIERENPDEIVCLGDVAQAGPEPGATLERIRSLGCPVITGNTDEWLFTMEEPTDSEPKPQWVYDIGEWVVDQLSPADERFLESFHNTVEIDLDDGRTLLCYHGSPRSPWEHIRPDTSEETLEEILEPIDADVLAGGHTHHQMYRRFKELILANTGSVGYPMERNREGDEYLTPWAEWATVETSAGSISVELKRTPFDLEEVIEAARRTDMPHKERWIDAWRAPS